MGSTLFDTATNKSKRTVTCHATVEHGHYSSPVLLDADGHVLTSLRETKTHRLLTATFLYWEAVMPLSITRDSR